MNYHCPRCPYTTRWLFTLEHHVQAHKKVAANFGYFFCDELLEKECCSQCKFFTTDEALLLKHLNGNCAHMYGEYNCSHCHLQTWSNMFLSIHLRHKKILQSVTSMYKCPYCRHRMQFKQNLARHIQRKHEGLRIMRYRCMLCPYQCEFKCDLKMHTTRKHTDISQIEWHNCELCEYRAVTAKLVRYHIRDKHSNNVYSCNFCPFTTTILSCFRRHKKMHGTRNPHSALHQIGYKCDQCEFTATHPTTLGCHKVIKHTAPEDIKWIQCNICPYKAKVQSYMTKHMYRTHKENKRTFQCPDCPYMTDRKFSLKVHQDRNSCNKKTKRKKKKWT